MGLFSDICETIVDLKTGAELSGEKLAEATKIVRGVSDAKDRAKALAPHGWGICGNKVSKKARFCSKCGHGAPKGWVTCPSCRKWIGNDSRFCPHCNHPLHPEERVDLAGGVWDREPGAFAQRIELSDVTGIAKSGLKIQEGTLAILLDAGKKSAILGPGRHTPEGTLRNINWFGAPPPRSVVMVDSGDCVFRMDFKGMRTAEELPVDVVAEITIRFDPSEANGFLANMMKNERMISAKGGIGFSKSVQAQQEIHAIQGSERNVPEGSSRIRESLTILSKLDSAAVRIRASDISTWLVAEATAAVKDLCLQATVEDLVKDPERRPRFEDAIDRALKDLLKRSGLELVRVGYVDFRSAEYDKMCAQYAELELKRRQLEYDRKLHELTLAEDGENRNFKLTRRSEFEDERYRELVITADSERQRLDLDERKKRERASRQQETEEYLAQLAQEKGVSAESRRAELEIAKEVASGRIDAKKAEELLAKLARDHEIEFAELEHKFETERRLRAAELDEGKHRAAIDDIGRSETLKDAETAGAVKRSEIDTRNYEAKTAQELAQAAAENNIKNLERLAELDARERQSLADTVKGLSPEAMAALEKDPAQRARLMELAKMQREHELEKARLEASQKMTAEQILAHQTGSSATAASALAAKAQADAQAASAKANAEVAQHDKLLDEMKRMTDERVAHDELTMRMLHDIAAKAVEKPVTVVNGAQPAQPTPINIVK